MGETYLAIRQHINPYNILYKIEIQICHTYPLIFEPFTFAYLYGCIHKESLPVRPIISSLTSGPVSQWLQQKLNVISDHLSLYRIKNSREVYNKVNGLKIDDNDRLVTWA